MKTDKGIETKGTITEIKHFSTHDGPGIRTTIFLKGCPLRCKWCDNPETQLEYPQLYFIAKKCKDFGECVSICPTNAISMDKNNKIDRLKCILCMKCVQECPYNAFETVGKEVTVKEIYSQILTDLPFYGDTGGVTLSGGEPLHQPEFAIEILKLCHKNGISTVLDTSGFADSEVVKEVIKFVDMVLLDIKHMNSKRHKFWTGVSNELILKNATIIAAGQSQLRISIPLIPGFNDDFNNLKETANFIKSLHVVKFVDILPMHALGTDKYRALGRVPPYDEFKQQNREYLKDVVNLFHTLNLQVTLNRMM